MKKKYILSEFEIIYYDKEDVICDSSQGNEGLQGATGAAGSNENQGNWGDFFSGNP